MWWTFALGVVEKVFAAIVAQSLVGRRWKPVSRDEVIRMVESQVDRHSRQSDRLRMLEFAVAELDAVVQSVPSLYWGSDGLSIQRRRLVNSRQQALLADLHEAIEERRSQIAAVEAAKSPEDSTRVGQVQIIDAQYVTPATDVGDTSPPGSWASRVRQLPITVQRRRAGREDD